MTPTCKVTVGIKALNEERHIAAALQSALAAVRPLGGEVVLADSGSSDRTIPIAREFDVTVVQLSNPAERSCGAGAQLAFQHARGEYFYLLDGDMELDPEFLLQGIAYLESHPGVAGVGGRVIEMNTQGEGFQIRAAQIAKSSHWRAGEVDRLDCGGLYRTAAVREAGWFADRNLHAFEEFDLAARLRANGWTLARIDCPAVKHYGHTLSGYRLLWRRMRSGYSGAPGEILRGAIGARHLPIVLRNLGHVRHALAVIAWWLLLMSSLTVSAWLTLALVLVPLAALSWRRGSIRLGVYSLVSWNVTALGLVSGFFRPRVSPKLPLASVQLQEADRRHQQPTST